MSAARLSILIAFAAAIAAALPLVVLPLGGPAAPARVVFLTAPDPANLPEGVSIDRWSGRQAVLAGVDARAARALYAMGALIVIPVRTPGCLALTKAGNEEAGRQGNRPAT